MAPISHHHAIHTDIDHLLTQLVEMRSDLPESLASIPRSHLWLQHHPHLRSAVAQYEPFRDVMENASHFACHRPVLVASPEFRLFRERFVCTMSVHFLFRPSTLTLRNEIRFGTASERNRQPTHAITFSGRERRVWRHAQHSVRDGLNRYEQEENRQTGDGSMALHI